MVVIGCYGGDKVFTEYLPDGLGERGFPLPLSPATPMIKIYGDSAMTLLKSDEDITQLKEKLIGVRDC